MSRPLLEIQTREHIPIVYRAPISEKIHCLHCCWSCVYPCSCLCVPLITDLALESTYVHIHDNRLEYNYPTMTMTWDCHCLVVDDVHVVYFDRPHFTNVYALDECCCGCDQTVVMRQPSCSCATVHHSCCGRIWLHCLENPTEFMDTLTKTRTKRLTELHIMTDMERI